MTAVPAPGNRLPESRSRNLKQTVVANISLASERGVTAGSDVVRTLLQERPHTLITLG